MSCLHVMIKISYHLHKANVVADDLSRQDVMLSYHLKPMGQVVVPGILEELRDAQVEGLKGDHVKDKIKVKPQVCLVEEILGVRTFKGKKRLGEHALTHQVV